MPDESASQSTFPGANIDRLRAHVDNISGLRHGKDNYSRLERIAEYIESFFIEYDLPVTNQYFQFEKRRYRNVIARSEGPQPELPPLVVGAHYDGNRGTPGADDNASGVAVLLETVHLLYQLVPTRSIEFVAFTLEEPQTFTHVIRRGSRFFCSEARRQGARYQGAVILESVGYTSQKQHGWMIAKAAGIDMPSHGDFLAVVANGGSKPLMDSFIDSARRSSPSLSVVAVPAPAQGYLTPQVRFSDHSSFWEQDYPAIMLNDTVMFRNPNYHKPGDLPETLDYDFMRDVATAVAAFAGGLT